MLKKLLSLFLIASLLLTPCYAGTNLWGQTKPPLGSQIDWSCPLSQGLVGCWLMNEGGGNRITDIINQKNGKAVTPLWKGTDLSFGVANNSFDCGTKNSINVPALSIFLWLNHPSYSSSQYNTPFGYSVEANQKDWCIRLGQERFLFESGNGVGHPGDNITSKDNVWVKYVVTFDGVSVLKFYLDGIIKKTNSSYTNPITYTTPIRNFYIGNKLGGDDIYYSGSIRLAMVWNRVISPSEILSLYIDPYCFIKKPDWSLLKAAQAAGFIPTGKTLYNSVLYNSQI